MPDPDLGSLKALRRLRHVETDTARRELGDAMTLETALASRDSALMSEIDSARWITGDFDREVFTAWFARVRIERAELADAMLDARTRAAAARIALANRRVAETSAEAALASALAAKQAAIARKEQVVLEDVARALKHIRSKPSAS